VERAVWVMAGCLGEHGGDGYHGAGICLEMLLIGDLGGCLHCPLPCYSCPVTLASGLLTWWLSYQDAFHLSW
jgi:hypothetical protein